MKKIGLYFLVFLLSVVVFLFGFNHEASKQPNAYYQVYLDSELIGLIESREELENYINSQAEVIRENIRDYSKKIDSIDLYDELSSKYSLYEYSTSDRIKYLINNKKLYNLTDLDIENLKKYIDDKLYNYSSLEIKNMRSYITENEIYSKVNEVYTPNGIEIKKVYTYKKNIMTVQEIYKRIISKKSCTIAGYSFTIKSELDGVEDIILYTIDKKIFTDAIEKLITIFVDSDVYELYKKDEQKEITTVGAIIDNIYIEEDITYKATNISVNEKIYTDSNDLSAYLLYGDKFEQRVVQVQPGDDIESISYNNQISVQEFLIFNPQYTNRDNLLVAGTEAIISTIDPKVQVVVESHEVVDIETDFEIIEKYDETYTQGSVFVTQDGINGIDRVSQNVKSVNGQITYIDPVGKETIKVSIPKIITIGTRYIPTVGSLSSWYWPTNRGYTLTSYYGYRPQIFGEGNFHTGIDIAGTGYGSPVYASNNGVIVKQGYEQAGLGYHIIIDHNNGFFSVYGHMSGFDSKVSLGSTVERGQTIGYVGSSGWATGPHLHFEIRTCQKYSCHLNPLPYLSR